MLVALIQTVHSLYSITLLSFIYFVTFSMKWSALWVAVAAFATPIYTAAVAKRQLAEIDLTVLQFALTVSMTSYQPRPPNLALQLEHLENVFYKKALEKFTAQDFAAAGFDAAYFTNLQFIAQDEEAHVVVLTQQIEAAGAAPVAACVYNFGAALSDVRSFVTLGSVLEGVGVSAYLGGAAVVTSKDILTAAAAILVAEGLHQGIQRSSLSQAPSANIVGTPASPNAIFTLASAFIASCPPSNQVLPFKAFPVLTVMSEGATTPNATAMFSVGGPVPEPFFVTFVSGLDTISMPGRNSNGMVLTQVPAKTQGQSYAFITAQEVKGAIQDSEVLFGPAILEVTPTAPKFDLTIQ